MTADLPALFARARACFDAGQPEEAEALCRSILDRKPDFHAACHLLGMIAHRDGLEACLRRDLSTSAATFDRLAPVVRLMAGTGHGTDACLVRGCLPLPVHFYSPVPNIEDLRRRGVWRRRSPMTGIALDVDRQLRLLAELGAAYGEECRWPDRPDPDRLHAFHLHNDTFGFGCASALHMLLRRFRPRRVIEIGSGMSSRVIRDALRLNGDEDGSTTTYTVVDPYAAANLEQTLAPLAPDVLRVNVETLDLSVFDQLGANDVLFIDSGHTVRIGGDVNFLILDVLPRLAPGVLVHFHDIHLPYEYAEVYATNPAARVFWTEAYLLQAFLAFNSTFEVMLGLALLMIEHAAAFAAALPGRAPDSISGSFWIRRTA